MEGTNQSVNFLDFWVLGSKFIKFFSVRKLSLMTLQSDTKFKEIITCNFKYGMRNFVNFHPTTQKFQNFNSMGYFCPKYMRFELKKIRRNYLSWHWTVTQNLNKPSPCGFKNGMRNWLNFHYSTQKSEKVYIDGLFLSKGYNVKISLKGNAKIKGKLTCGLKSDIRNLVNFSASRQKSENLHFD